jgi:plastocyanin
MLMLAAASACSSGGDAPTPPTAPSGTPNDGHGDGGTGGPPPDTVTIRSTGMAPITLTIAVGSRVSFVNGDARPHDIAGGPDPTHPECPELDAVGFILSGQTRQSAVFTAARTCRYHDHTYVGVPEFTGTIVIE